jgi:hypothetical protein
MLRWLRDAWTGSAIVEFDSAFGLADSVARLRMATKRSIFSAMAQEAAVGTVTAERVSLQRVIPMVGNSFKPYFVGCFVESDGKVTLRGRFTMHVFTKLFMTMWFGGLVLIGLGASVTILRQPDGWIVPLAAFGMLGCGLTLVRSGQWFARRDPAWLSDVIDAALGAPAAVAARGVQAPDLGLPGHILPFAILIAIGGAVALGMAIAGIQPVPPGPNDPPFAGFPRGGDRFQAILTGGAMLAWAYGIYRQYRLAWWAGMALFAYLGINVLISLIQLLVAMPDMHQPFRTGIESVMATLVLALWAWWWYLQRRYFRS